MDRYPSQKPYDPGAVELAPGFHIDFLAIFDVSLVTTVSGQNQSEVEPSATPVSDEV